MKSNESYPHLIRCGDDGLAPWAIACVHICEGTATDVVPVPHPEGSEVENDWLCGECFEKHFGGGPKPESTIYGRSASTVFGRH